MDKYELNIRIEQIKKLVRQKNYAEAAKVADTIDFYKVKENRILSLLADVYEASGRYENAKDILIEAYQRTSLGRQLAYRLVKICIKSGHINEAEEFYKDFLEVAPRDNSRYILQYQLAAAKGESLEKRTEILETYLADDMDERWAFELAKLYHKSGQRDKCIQQCDTVILWFSEGKYVDKALELKMIYAPLTKQQQKKYEERWIAKAPSNIKVEEIKVKEFDANNKFNTVNIQNAIKESMDILMNNDVEQTSDSEEETDLAKTKVVFTDEVVNELLSHTVVDVRVPSEKLNNTVPLSPLLDMDAHGQIALSMEEPVDDQIEGQLTIEELISSYEEREAEQQQVISETAATSFEENTSDKELAEDSLEDELSEDELSDDNDEVLDIQENIEIETEENIPEMGTMDISLSKDLEDDESQKIIEKELEEIEKEEEPEEESEEPKVEEKTDKSTADNQVIKSVIRDFVAKYSGIQGLDRQLLMILQGSIINNNNRIIVMGEVKSGKTALAIDLIKIINKIKEVRGRKIAKINGEILNKKNISEYYEKLSGMDFVIEKAGALTVGTINGLIEEINKDTDDKIIILEDEKTNAENVLSANSGLAELFENKVVVKQNKVRDWAVFAKSYADEQGYIIDEMGMLALHAKIDALYAITLVINKSHVENVIDEAINKTQNKGVRRILRVFGKEKEKVLREEDFA